MPYCASFSSIVLVAGLGLKGIILVTYFLTALRDILGSEAEAITAASRILKVSGR